MAGSIRVKYAQKTYKQQNADRENSVDIIPESMSYMTFETQKDAGRFASSMIDKGYHIIEITDDYKK
tara:strand:+ start:559 stop:759 length:201 start_codon:yes stop_codon:yes gene_type:complete